MSRPPCLPPGLPTGRLPVHRRALAALLLLLPGSAGAVGGPAQDFRASPSAHDGQGALQLLHPDVGGRGAGYLGAFGTVGERFHSPDSRRRVSGLHLGGGYALADWLRVELDLPFLAAVTDGEGAEVGIGEAQLSATVPVFRLPDGRFGLGIAPFVQAPAQLAPGNADGALEGGAALLIGGAVDGGSWRVNAGLRASPSGAPVGDVGVGGAAHLSPGFGLGAELMARQPLGAAAPGAEVTANPVEGSLILLLGADRQQGAVIAFTTGLVPDAGSPQYRVTVGLSGRRAGTVGDPDGDGLFGLSDACPHSPEDKDEAEGQPVDGCYDPDNDLDGIPDALDRCPNEAEDEDGFQDRDGCQDPDNDFDGVPDTDDACPMTAGLQSAQGCPDGDGDGVGDALDECPTRPGRLSSFGCPDADGDRVPDFRDQCPGEAISPKLDPTESNGCPTRAYYAGGRIQILDKVNFETGSDVIREDSYGLLRDVARTILATSEIRRIEIGGHTDSVGSAAANLRLARRRAASVRAFLIAEGVPAKMLVSKGYGEAEPIDTNLTDAGRYQNRRVEFVVIETR